MTKTSGLAIAILLVSLTAVAARGSYGGTPGQWLGEARLPMVIGRWQGSQAPAEDPKTVAWLGADGMVSRSYAVAGGAPVALYIAYFERQRPGVTIHSPLHCLPGAGWDVIASSTISYQPERAIEPVGSIRRLIAQKGTDRAVVLYWYALHGRMVASEIASRAYLLGDRIRFSRNDAALVRIVVFSDGDDRAAEQQGLAFIEDLRPQCHGSGVEVIARILTLAACSALLVSACGTPRDTARRHIDKGDSYAAAGRYNAAAIEYRNAVRDWPSGIDGYLKLGDAQQACGRPADAYRTFAKAIEVAPDDARASVGAGRLLLASDRTAEARRRADAAVERDPGSSDAKILLGAVLTTAGDYQNAEDVLRGVVARVPGSVAARVALADLLIVRQRGPEAEEQLRAAVAARPHDELANRALAALLQADGRAGESERFLKIAAGAIGQRYRSSLALADFYIAAGRPHEARTALSAVTTGEACQQTMARAVQARREALSVY